MAASHGLILKETTGYSVQFERLLPHSATIVWNALTNPAILSLWLADVTLLLQEGGDIQLRFTNTGQVIDGKITAVNHLSLLQYTWQLQDGPGAVVRWELSTTGTGQTLLLLTHSGLQGDIYTYAASWHVHLRLLTDVLAAHLQQFEWDDNEWRLEYAYYAGDLA